MNQTLNLGLFSRSRVPLVRQTEISECGLACLTMIANYHGLKINLGTMRRRFAPSLRGAALRTLMEIADRIGLVPRAVKLPLEKLSELELPAVIHWGMNHYVVLERVRRDAALIHNPSGSSAWLPISEVSNHFTGAALELRPADHFRPVEQRTTLRLSQLWGRMRGAKRAVLQTLALSAVLEAFILASPYYMQLAVDSALPALDRELLSVLALGFALFSIIYAGATLLRSFVFLLAGSAIGFNVATNVARRLFRLPVGWFERRQIGDVLSRFQSILPIQKMLTEGAVAGIIDGTLAIFTLFLMFIYSVKLASVALGAFALYGLVRWFSFSIQRQAQEAGIVLHGVENSTLIETLRGITTLRLFGRETLRHALWQTRLADAVNADVRTARITIWQATASTLIFSLENILTIWLAIDAVIAGSGFSLGMAFAYFAYKTQFIQKATSLIDQSIAFRMLGLHLERLSDIALSQEDRGFGDDDLGSGSNKTLGQLELRGVCYRYSPSDPLVLDGLDLIVRPGEHLAITGPSGGGKSTLAKILLGLVEPANGQVLLDGMPLSTFGYRNYHNITAAVLQEDVLFTGSLIDNIALFDEAPNVDDVVAAAVAASIHEDIIRMPMQYETLVGDMGSGLSGGQKQRVFLARALYRKPKILIIDEGTAHLDVDHEAAVNKAIAIMGITRIVIAHRQETVRAATRVVVLRHGRLRDSA